MFLGMSHFFLYLLSKYAYYITKFLILLRKLKMKIFNDGYLGSHIDEERSEMRYAMRIAELRESSDLRTQTAPVGYPASMFVSVCLLPSHNSMRLNSSQNSLVKNEYLAYTTCRWIRRSGHFLQVISLVFFSFYKEKQRLLNNSGNFSEACTINKLKKSSFSTRNQARLPAELKHISKRRKRN